jgi:hypothetical protein
MQGRGGLDEQEIKDVMYRTIWGGGWSRELRVEVVV